MTDPALTSHQFKIKGNKLWTLTQEYYDELKDTYPLHDVEGEMRAAKLWCRTVSASRRKTAKGMHRFLNGWVSRSEATGHVTVDPEKSPSEVIYDRTVQEKISDMASVIKEWSDDKLRASPTFQAGWKYPEFRAWVKEQRAGLKADNPPPSEPKKAVATPNVAMLQPDTTADLPPPRDDDFTGQSQLVDDFVKKYNLFENNS